MTIAWTHVGPTILAAFSASLVEFVEALTVVLAVGSVRGWRDALLGSAVAVLVLLLIIAVLGPALTAVPLHAIQLAVGVLLLLFGLRWLRKAILRAAGIIPLHDEGAAFSRAAERMRDLTSDRPSDRPTWKQRGREFGRPDKTRRHRLGSGGVRCELSDHADGRH